ncbi:MAG: PKD domain-containing protein, partial [Bacteroidales bacterium]|nr:PKD domain-containing protein [Bacteroidales bacterium]
GGTYYLTVVDGNNCSNVASVNVVINANPAVSITTNSPVCEGGTLTMMGSPSGMVSYNWSGPGGWSGSGQTVNRVGVTTLMSGVYYLTVTDGNACTGIANVNVVVNEAPVVNITTNSPVCEGETLTLNGFPSGMAQYIWSGPAGFSSNNQNETINNVEVMMSGIYYLTVKDNNGCYGYASYDVVINPKPIVTLASNSPVCIGATLNLYATPNGMNSYIWNGPQGFFSTQQNPSINNVTLLNAGTYYITVIDGHGCNNYGSINIIVNELPLVTISTNSPLCEGNDLFLATTPNGMVSYNWQGPSLFISGEQSPIIENVTTANAGVYYVTVVDVNGCSNVSSAEVVVNNIPIVSVTNNGPMCEGGTINISVLPGGMTYNWNGPNNFTSNEQLITLQNVNSSMEGIYYVTVTSPQNCSSIASTEVIVYENPVVNIISNTPVCENSTLTINAQSPTAISYNWSGPNGFFSNTSIVNITNVQLINGGTYYLTVFDNNNCFATSSINVVINQLPQISINTSQTNVCEGTMVILEATGGDFYVWNTGATSHQIAVVPQQTTTYSVTGTDNNGCSNVSSVIINVSPKPQVNAGNDQQVCEGTPVVLMATGANTYQWSNNIVNGSEIVPPIGNNVYYVTGTDVNGCTSIDSVVIVVNAKPFADAGNNIQMCLGSTVQLTASGGNSYMWSTGQNQAQIQVSPVISTMYYVTVYNIAGCSNVDSVYVVVNSNPIADAGQDINICYGDTAYLIAWGGITYIWGTGEAQQEIYVTPNETTLYYVTVANEFGCTDVDYVTVIVNQPPTINYVINNANCGMADGSIQLTVEGGSGDYYYLWDENAGSSTLPYVSNLPAGVYFVTVNDGICEVVSQFQVEQLGGPQLSVVANTNFICAGDTITLIASGANNYIWQPSTYLLQTSGSQVQSVPYESITYTVYGTNGNCTDSIQITLTVNSLPQAYFAYTDLGMGQISFTDMSYNAESWYWSFGDNNFSSEQNPTHTYNQEGMYQVMLIVTNACGSDTATQNVNVIIGEISSTSCNSMVFNIYPNPNNGTFNVKLVSLQMGEVLIDVYDVNSKKVFTKTIVKDSKIVNIKVDIKERVSGIYSMIIRLGSEYVRAPIVIKKN